MLRAENLTALRWLVHGFSTRAGGVSSAYRPNDLNLGFTAEDTAEHVTANRAKLVRAAAGLAWPLVEMQQIHSDRIHFIEAAPKPGKNAQGDGMLAQLPEVLLAIKTADCLPILLVDPENCAIAALHAGWRGTLARIAEKGVGEMRRRFGSDPKKILAAIGPGIHACCYAVGEEVREKFRAQFAYADELFREVFDSDEVRRKYPLLFMNQRAPGHGDTGPELHMDLVEANRRQMLAAGVSAKNIEALPLCTSCRTDLFFSHRAEFGRTGRMMAVIGIRPKL